MYTRHVSMEPWAVRPCHVNMPCNITSRRVMSPPCAAKYTWPGVVQAFYRAYGPGKAPLAWAANPWLGLHLSTAPASQNHAHLQLHPCIEPLPKLLSIGFRTCAACGAIHCTTPPLPPSLESWQTAPDAASRLAAADWSWPPAPLRFQLGHSRLRSLQVKWCLSVKP